MKKAQLRNAVNKAINGKTNGFFTDEFWAGKSIVLDEIGYISGLTVTCDRAEYRHENGTPVGKQWNYTVTEDATGTFCHLLIVASGAGTVKDPLSRYDIVAYAS